MQVAVFQLNSSYSMPPPAASGELRGLPSRWPALMAIVCGAAMHISFNLGGQFFLGELILLGLLPILLFDRFYVHRVACQQQEWLWRPVSFLLLGLIITTMGYVLSDFYRNNDPSDYLRGWARLFFLGVDLLAISMLVSIQIKNLWYFVFGYATLGIIVLVGRGVPWDDWKFGYGVPLTLSAIAFLCLIKGLSVHVRGVVLLALGLLNMFMDYRSLGAICVITAIIGWVHLGTQKGSARLIGIMVLSVIITAMLALAYSFSQGSFEQRRQTSNSIRLSSAMVGINAVLESPFIGYGSWSKDARFAKQLADLQFRMSKAQENPLYDFDIIRQATFAAHSQIIEAWTEGGMLGAAFFFVYLLFMLKALKVLLISPHDQALDPLLTMLIIGSLWALFMSPFKGLSRLDISLACIASIAVINAMRIKRAKGASIC
jgi:O-Antigen ligase